VPNTRTCVYQVHWTDTCIDARLRQIPEHAYVKRQCPAKNPVQPALPTMLCIRRLMHWHPGRIFTPAPDDAASTSECGTSVPTSTAAGCRWKPACTSAKRNASETLPPAFIIAQKTQIWIRFEDLHSPMRWTVSLIRFPGSFHAYFQRLQARSHMPLLACVERFYEESRAPYAQLCTSIRNRCRNSRP
jgi:hypothetical protein